MLNFPLCDMNKGNISTLIKLHYARLELVVFTRSEILNNSSESGFNFLHSAKHIKYITYGTT